MKVQAVELLYTTYPAERLARHRVASNGTRRSRSDLSQIRVTVWLYLALHYYLRNSVLGAKLGTTH